MAKILYGGTAADFTVDKTTVDSVPNVLILNPAANLIAFDAGIGGSQITDLNLFNNDYAIPGAAVPSSGVFPSDSNGTFLVWGHDVLDYLFVADPNNPTVRWVAHPVNIQLRLKQLEAGAAVNLAAYVDSLKGTANGIAGLDSNGDVPIGQLPTGTTSTTVLRGDQVLEDKHAIVDSLLVQEWDGTGTTPNRRTSRTDVRVWWWSPVEPSYAAGKAISGKDLWLNTNP